MNCETCECIGGESKDPSFAEETARRHLEGWPERGAMGAINPAVLPGWSRRSEDVPPKTMRDEEGSAREH